MTPLDQLNKAAPDQWKDAAAGNFSVEVAHPDTPQAARQAIEAFVKDHNAGGWMRYLDNQDTLRIENAADLPADNIPYCGEFACKEGNTSLHLRLCDGRYTVQIITESPGEEGIILEERRIGSIAVSGYQVCYRVFWKKCDINGLEEYRPTAARFAGFEPLRKD